MNISALAQAAKSGSLIDFKRVLRTSEDDIHRTDGDGWTPLHHAAKNGHLSIVTILLEKGSDPALKTKKDETALDLARDGNHSDVIQLLESRTDQTSTSTPVTTSTTSTSGDLSPLSQPSVSTITGAVKGPAVKESSTPTEPSNSSVSPRPSTMVANSVKIFGSKVGSTTTNATTTSADKAEIDKLKADVAALRKKAIEEESRRLRADQEKAAQENETVAQLRKDANTLKASLAAAQAQIQKISADRDIFQESLRTFEAADTGVKEDQFKLGSNYEEGKGGLSKDASRAVGWYRRAAEKGHVNALLKMGICHMQGVGVTANEREAVSWYRKAADLGQAEAQYNLGSCYDAGVGVETDKLEAKSWYQKAANQGHKGALMSLR